MTRAAVAALLMCVPPAVADPPSPPVAADEAAVRKVLTDQVAAWNKGDLAGFMSGYWNDERMTYISGAKSVRGWKALHDRYRTAYQGEGKEMGKLSFSDLDSEAVGNGAVLVRGRWEVNVGKDAVGGWFTLLFRKLPEGWKITHDHTSK
ncbi:MAG: nuclear transport factor 2 family protein [Gemmataceae bacterium]